MTDALDKAFEFGRLFSENLELKEENRAINENLTDLALKYSDLKEELEESRREYERLKTENETKYDAWRVEFIDMVQERDEFQDKLQSSLTREAAMWLAVEEISNVITVGVHENGGSLAQHQAILSWVKQALSTNSTNPILDAMRAAKISLSRIYRNSAYSAEKAHDIQDRAVFELIFKDTVEALSQLSTALGNGDRK